MSKMLEMKAKYPNTQFWVDSCAKADLAYGISLGAVGATTNPTIVSQVLQKELPEWEDTIRALFAEAAMCDTAGVAFHGLERAGVKPGGTYCVIGPGPIGFMAMKLARAMGAAHVICVGRGARLQAAIDLGACDPDMAINFEEKDPVEEVLRITNGIGADNVCEASGAHNAMTQAIEMVRKGGSIAMLGTPPEGTMEPIPIKKVTFKELTLVGSRGNPNATVAVVNLMSTGQLKVKEMITHTYPLTEFAAGMDTFVNRKEGCVKVVFFPNEIPEEYQKSGRVER